MSTKVINILKYIILIAVLCLIFSKLSLTSYKNNIKVIKQTYKKTKTILYWDPFYGSADYNFGTGSEIFSKCEIQNCVATFNRSFLPVDKFDAIMFHGARFELNKDKIPTKRSTFQKYIFYSLESYYNSVIEPKTVNDFYNWTMTYKRDSDIFAPYGKIINRDSKYVLPSIDNLKHRKKKVAWFVSNCYTKGSKRRMRYVQELKKYIPVDIYGTCGTLKCTKSEKCYEMLEENYKFYLSFENSFCEDYITEKLYNILQIDVIPIVISFAAYEQFVPEHSYIDANKFINPKHLAEYLWSLDENYNEYLKYFKWKKKFTVTTKKDLCDLCKKLHEPIEFTSYKDIKDWFFGFGCVAK